MKSLSEQLQDVGLKLTDKEETQVRESLKEIKKSFNKRLVCRFCTEEIKFVEKESRQIPHNLDGAPHWQTCPYSTFFQKKMSFNIMKKLAVFFTLKYGANFEKSAALTPSEVRVIHAVLEREFRSRPDIVSGGETMVVQCETEEEVASAIQKTHDNTAGEVSGEIQFKPAPTDPIGDPDEERAPAEKDIPLGVTLSLTDLVLIAQDK